MSDRRTNIRVASIVAALGVLGLAYLVPAHVGRLASPAALLPVIGFSALIALGAALLATALRERHEPREEAASEEEEEEAADDAVPLLPVLVVLAAYAGLLGQLGFLVASTLALLLLLWLYRIRRPVRLVLVTAGTIAVIHVGIERMLGTPLPSGDLLKILPF